MKAVIHLLLCLSLVLATMASATGQGMAAQGAARAQVIEMVICSENGPQKLLLDASGQPAQPKPCCDCAKCLGTTAFLPPSHRIESPLRRLHPLRQMWQHAGRPAVQPLACPLARGPPAPGKLPAPAVTDRDMRPQARLFVMRLEFGQVICRKRGPEPGQSHEEAP